MRKMGGTICDNCRVIIFYLYGTAFNDEWWERKAKAGHTMHFCSTECARKMTPKESRHELTKHSDTKTPRLDGRDE